MTSKSSPPDNKKLDEVVAAAHRNRSNREQDYREKSLKMYPWVCGRCSREFTRENLHELTVHHRDHNHDNNPEDGSNWELLCLYCHDNEHARYLDGESKGNTDSGNSGTVTHNPLAGLAELLNKDKQ